MDILIAQKAKLKMKSKGMDFFFKNKWVLIHVQKNKKAPETLDTKGNVKITLPETATNSSVENVDTNGNVKTTPNLYLQPLDTMEDTSIDTTNLDFSSSNFSKNDLEKQNKDIVNNATDFLVTSDNGTQQLTNIAKTITKVKTSCFTIEESIKIKNSRIYILDKIYFAYALEAMTWIKKLIFVTINYSTIGVQIKTNKISLKF